MERRHAQAHEDAAEHAHLQGGDAQTGGGGVGRHRFHAARRADHCADGGVHDEVGDRAREGSDLFFLFRHADRDAHREEQSEVAEYHVAALVHDVQNGVKDAARVDHAGQVIGLQHGLVGKGAADPQQQPRHREQRDGEHEGPTHTL